MAAGLLDGERVAAQLRAEVAARVSALHAGGHPVGLGAILVGDDPASARYVEMKRADCAAVGISSRVIRLGATASEEEVLAAVAELNADPRVSAFIVQLPLPAHLDTDRILTAVVPDKDADGLHPFNLGELALGRPRVVPCTPAGIVELLRRHGISLEGRHLVVVGRGLTIGRPLSILASLAREGLNAAVTVAHSRVADLAALVRGGDIVVAAAGRPGLVTASMVKPGAVVVGAGTSFVGRRLLSDVADEVATVASWVTPRIGGVGPMTRAMLLVNTVEAAERWARSTG